MLKYIVYKTTNLINNKIYIGVHKCDPLKPDDLYRGSGPGIQAAISKYGITNFSRTTIKSFDSQREAYLLESAIVDQDFINRSDTYNMTLGGLGGWDYVNSLNLVNPMHNPDIVKKVTESTKLTKSLNPEKYRLVSKNNWAVASKSKLGKTHSQYTKLKQSLGIKEYYSTHTSKLKGVPKTDIHKQKQIASWTKDRRIAQSELMKQKIKLDPTIVQTRIGHTNSENHNKRISESKKAYWESAKKIKGICPHCGKIGILAGLKRWHFDNCRSKDELKLHK